MNIYPQVEDIVLVNKRRIISMGTRVIVHGNREHYAAAYVERHEWDPSTQETRLILSWPNTPGGPSTSKVWTHDEGDVWQRYNDVN
jgi:hypothetical protein